MKKYLGLVASFILVFILTGCVKYDSTVEVKRNKKVNYTIIYAFNSSMIDSMKSQYADEDDAEETDDEEELDNFKITEEDKRKFKENGFKVEKYEKDGYEGVKLSKSWNNIDSISSDKDTVYELEDELTGDKKEETNMFKVKKGFFKNTYTLKIDGSSDSMSSEGMDLSSMMDLSFTLKLPKKANSNNATTVNKGGKELVWDLSKSKSIEATFEIYNAPFYIAIGGGILLLVVIIIVIIKKGKKGTPIAGDVVNGTIDTTVNGISNFDNSVAPVEPATTVAEPIIEEVVNNVEPIEQPITGDEPVVENSTTTDEVINTTETGNEPVIEEQVTIDTIEQTNNDDTNNNQVM